MKLTAAGLLFVAVLVLPEVAHAAWAENGIRICPVESVQENVALASDGAGGVIVVWQDGRNSDGTLYAQRFSSAGVPQWDPAGKQIATGTYMWFRPQVVSDGEGGATIAWATLSSSGGEFRVTRIGANGAIAGGWPAAGHVIEPPGGVDVSPIRVVLTPDGAGGALVACSAFRFCSTNCYGWPRSAFVQWFSPDGPRWGTAVTVSEDPYENIYAAPARVAPDAFEIAICRDTYPSLDRTRVDSSGDALGRPPILPVQYGFRDVASVPDLGGGMYALWTRYTAQSHLLHFDPNGVVSPGWPDTGLVLLGEPHTLASDEHGGVLISSPSSSIETRLRRLTSSGAPAPGWLDEGTTVGGGAFSLVAGDGDGGGLLAGSNGNDLVAHRVLASAELHPAWPEDGVRFCTVPAAKSGLAMIREGAALYVAWRRSGGTDPWELESRRVYLQRIVIDSPTPALVSLASAEADPSGVRIRWVLGQAAGSLDVERNSGAGWARYAAVLAGRDDVAFEDADVTPGARYGYRLRDRDGVVLSGSEVWLDVPLATLSIRALGLGGAAPEFAVTLPRAGESEIEIVDVAGRRVVTQRVEGLPAGSHRVRIDRSLVSGVWFARLSQGGRSATTRFCSIR